MSDADLKKMELLNKKVTKEIEVSLNLKKKFN